MSTATVHNGKLTRIVSQEEIIDFSLYSSSIGNDITNNENIYKLLSIDKRHQE